MGGGGGRGLVQCPYLCCAVLHPVLILYRKNSHKVLISPLLVAPPYHNLRTQRTKELFPEKGGGSAFFRNTMSWYHHNTL